MYTRESKTGGSRARLATQRGAVLFIAMVFLVILTVLAIAASSSSIMQERMTGGMRNRQLSLMGADTTLRGGEELLWTLSYNGRQPFPPCVEGGGLDCVYLPSGSGRLNGLVQNFRTSKTWIPVSADGARAYSRDLTDLDDADITATLTSVPRFIIEDLGPDLPTGAEGQQVGAVNPETTSLVGKRKLYRLTARSQGGSGAVMSITESTYSAMDLTNTGHNPGSTPPTP